MGNMAKCSHHQFQRTQANRRPGEHPAHGLIDAIEICEAAVPRPGLKLNFKNPKSNADHAKDLEWPGPAQPSPAHSKHFARAALKLGFRS